MIGFNSLERHLFNNYSNDYFDDNMKKVIYYSIDLIALLYYGRFEFDTYVSDNTLVQLREALNRIDV